VQWFRDPVSLPTDVHLAYQISIVVITDARLPRSSISSALRSYVTRHKAWIPVCCATCRLSSALSSKVKPDLKTSSSALNQATSYSETDNRSDIAPFTFGSKPNSRRSKIPLHLRGSINSSKYSLATHAEVEEQSRILVFEQYLVATDFVDSSIKREGDHYNVSCLEDG
jgi:hypothetical protein